MTARHPATQQIMHWLEPNPSLKGTQQVISRECYAFALSLLAQLGDGPELTAGLRKLLEAKDAFVRQSLADKNPGWIST
jgi:hypothetical protein